MEILETSVDQVKHETMHLYRQYKLRPQLTCTSTRFIAGKTIFETHFQYKKKKAGPTWECYCVIHSLAVLR